MKKQKKILNIKVEHKLDEDPDLSYLGKYTRKTKKWTINRRIQHDWRREELEYFEPANPPTGKTREERKEEWKYCMENYRRHESYNNGNWHMIGIIAKAEVQLGSNIIQTITSGGLWGIESDSDNEYKKQVEDEELSNLCNELQAIGFTRKEILKACESVERD